MGKKYTILHRKKNKNDLVKRYKGQTIYFTDAATKGGAKVSL